MDFDDDDYGLDIRTIAVGLTVALLTAVVTGLGTEAGRDLYHYYFKPEEKKKKKKSKKPKKH
jgi:hypothetical protein